ncbi:MAG: chalcone isomerase family protein, partial [Desulfosarcina sp.]
MNAMYKNAIFGTVMVLMLGISSSQVMAIEVENVVFQKEVRVGDQSLELKGAGVLYYLRFIKAYVGALYVPPGTAPDGVLADTPKRLEVEYFHALNGEDFGPATYKGLSKNLGQEAIDRMRDRIEYHNSLYVDVKPGDRYSLTYLPGIGTELALNGEPKGIIEGADFAAAIFSLWLGEYPFDAR